MERIKPKKLTSPDYSSYVCELMRWMFAETCHFFYQSSVFCYKFILRHQVLTFINMVVLSVNLIFIWGFRKWRSRKVHHLPSTLSDRTSSCNKLLRRLQSKAYSGETYLKKTRLRNIHGTGFLKTYDHAPASAGDYVTADCDVGRRHSSTQQTSGDHDETLDEITWGFDTSPMLSYHPPPETDHVAKQESISSADGVSQRTTRTKKRNPKCELKRKKVIAKKKIAHVDSSGRRDRRKKNKIVIDKLMSGTSSEHGGSPTKVKKQLTPRVPIGRSVKSQCPQSETTSSKRSSTLQETPAKRRLESRTVSPKKSVKKSYVLRPPQDPVMPRVSISPEKFFLQNKAVHETDLSSESDQAEKAPALQGLTVDSRSEASNVCKRDSWIWFSREARPSMENFASRQRKFKSEDPRVAELAAEIRRQDEMNRDIEREAESLIESSSQSNKIASTKWVQQPIGPGLQTASRIRARGRVRPSPYARHNTNPTVSRKSREPERKLLSSARKHLSPQKYLVHFLKDNAIDNQKLRADVKMALRNADISFTSSEGDVISHTRVATPWDPEPTYSKVHSPHPRANDQPGELLNSPLAGPYDSLTARKIVMTCGRQSPPNDNSVLLSSLDSSLTFQQPAPLVKVDAHAEARFSRSFSLTPAQEIPPVLFNVQNSIGSSPFRNYPHGRRPHSTGKDPRQVYSATARTQNSFQNQIIQTQGRAKMEKRVHLSAGDSESDSLQREISVQDSTLRQVLITKEVNTAIHRLLFDTEQSSSSLSPSSFNKQSVVSRGIMPREISAITYARHPAEDAPGQKTCGVKNNVSIQFSVQANPQESSSFKSDSAIRSKRTNIYNPDYYLGKRVTCKRQLTVTNQTESTTESSSNRWRKKSRPHTDVNSPVVYSSEHSTPTPLLPKSTGDSVIEKAQLLNQRRPEAVRATPMSGPTQQYHTDSASDLSLGRQDAMPKNVEETTSTENQFSAPRKSSIPILNRFGGDSTLANNQLSGIPEYKKQTHQPPAKADTPSNNLNQRSNLVQESVPRWNVIKESGTQSSVCLSVNQQFQQRINGQAGHMRKPSRSHEVILPCNTMPNKVINIGLRSKPLDFSNRPNKPDIISLQDFNTRVSPSETLHMFRPGGACDVCAPTAFPATDRSHSAATANGSIQASTADEKPVGSDNAVRLASDARLKPQKVVTYSDSYWARKVATKQTSPDGPQKSPSLVLGKSESCHSLKSSLPKPLRVSNSSDHVGVPMKPIKSAMGVSGLCSHVMTGSTNNSSSNAPYQRVGESKAVPPTMVGHFFFVTTTTATSDKPPVYPDDSFLNAGNIGTVGGRKGLENISNYRTDLDNKHSGDGDALVSNLTRKTVSPKMGLLNMLKSASTPSTDSQPHEEDIKAGAKSTWTNARVNQQRVEAVDSKNSCSSDDTEPSQMVLPPTSSDDDDDFDNNDIAEKTRTDGSRGEHFLPTVPFIQEDQSKPTVAPTLSNQDSGYEESMSDQAQKTKKPSEDGSGPQPKTQTETAVTDSSSSCSEGSHNSEGFTNVSRTSEECDSETQWMSSRTDNAFVSPRHSTASTSSRLSKFTISKSQRPCGDMNRECASAAFKSPTRDVQNRLSENKVLLLCDDEHDKYSDWLSSGATSKESRASVYAREGNSEAPSSYLTKGLERVTINKPHADCPSVEAAGAREAPGYVHALPLQLSTEMAAMGASSGPQPRCVEDRLSQKTHVNDLRRVNTIPDCTTNCVPSKIWQNYHSVDGGRDNTSPEFSERRENMQDASCSTTADVRMLESLLSSELGEPCMNDSPSHSSNTSLDLSTSFGLSTFEESDTRHTNTADTFGDTFVKGMNRVDLVPNGGSREFDSSKILDPFTYSVSQTAHQKRDATSANIILLPPTSSDEEDGECPKTFDCGGDREKTGAARLPISSMARPSKSKVNPMSPLLSRDHASDSLLGKTCPEQRADNSCSTDVRKRELIPKRSVNFEELLKRF